MSTHSVRRHLRLEAEAYDETIRRWIPGYERMLEVTAEGVARGRPHHVLDVGAGTGGLSVVLLARQEVGRVELLDIDPDMLEQARARLESFGSRVRFTLGSYEDELPACDAMAASLALHHIPTMEGRRAVFERAFRAIRPGGVFVNADVRMPHDGESRAALFEMWAEHMGASGIGRDQAFRHFEEWSEEDTYLPVSDELAAFRDVGFEAECVWEVGPVGVIVARRP